MEFNSINDIIDLIDTSIQEFQGSIPEVQQVIFKELQPLIKGIDIKNGRILNNFNNLRLIGEIKNKLQKVIVNEQYKQSVNNFMEAFAAITRINNQYFSQFNKKYSPSKTLAIIRDLAIETTITDLVGQGMQTGVIDPIASILNQNITSGGDYATFFDELRSHILDDENGDGSLARYTKQITIDALHQYNAQYSDAIAQDLNFNWGRYVGSLITTSRQFCVALVAKEFVNRKELPAIIKGRIDGKEMKLSKTTGLPLGMIPGTNENNFKIRRGGYTCRHQFQWIPDNVVPFVKFRDPDNLKNVVDQLKANVADEKFDTEKIYKDPEGGGYTSERMAMHEEMMKRYMQGGSSDNGTTFFTGGAPATGKSFLVSQRQKESPGIIVIDPDKIKEMIPEYNALTQDRFLMAAAKVHEESSMVAKSIVEAVSKKGWDAIVDGVGDGKYDSVVKKVKQQRDRGKKVVADYATTNVEISVKRALERGQKIGRFVPEEYIRSMHQEISRLFPKFIEDNLFDELNLWDTTSNPARKIFSMKDGKATIIDRAAYNRFLDQGN